MKKPPRNPRTGSARGGSKSGRAEGIGTDRERPERAKRFGRSERPDRERTEKPEWSERPPRAERRERPERPGSDRERPVRGKRFDRAERPERSERSSRPERRERPERSERGARPDRSERREWTEKSERFDRPVRSNRPRSERPSRFERSARSDKPSRYERPERAERSRPMTRRDGGRAVDRTTKRVWKAGTMLCPLPVVMVSCVQGDMRPNIVTVAWAGTICSDPPMVSISLRKATHSHGMIMASREFVVNVPSVHEISATDLCGVISGRDEDKFARTGLTPGEATSVRAPIIMECPLNLECKVQRVFELGSHTMFMAEVTAVQVSEYLITGSDRLALEKAGLAAFAHGEYFALGKKLGFFGYSVRRRKNARRV